MEHNTRTKALSWLLSLAMLLSLIPSMSIPAQAAVVLNTGSTEWTDDVTITDTLEITGPVTVTKDIKLTIPENMTLTVTGGITATDKTLTVAGKGTLVVTGTDGSNGADDVKNGNGKSGSAGGNGVTGNLIVDGAIVNLTGGNGGSGGNADKGGGGAGGAGGHGVAGNVTVKGGTVTVTGGTGGTGGRCDNPSRSVGAGGAGGSGVAGTVTVKSGTVTTTGGSGGNGGSNHSYYKDGGAGGAGGSGVAGTVTVKSGTATATGGSGGSGGSGGGAGGPGASGAIGNGVTGAITGSIKVSADGGEPWTAASGTTTNSRYVTVGPPHIHQFTFGEPEGDSIVATCANEDSKCQLEDLKATLKIAPDAKGGSTAELTGDVNEFDSAVTGVTITYKKKTDATTWSDETAANVSAADAGFFEASAEVVSGNTISVKYGINAIHKGTATGGKQDCNFTVPKVATVGAEIEPTVTLDTGYEVKSIKVKNQSTEADISEAQQANAKNFIMPDYDVIVDVVFGKIDYTIGGLDQIANGTIAASKNESPVSAENPAQIEDVITLTATPAHGYAFDTVTATDKHGPVTLSGEGANRTFTMRDSNVTVTATFVGLPFEVTTVSDPANGGTTTVTGSAVVTADGTTTAKAGTEVTLTPVPAAGYKADSVAVATTAGNTPLTVTNNKFTMPTEGVTATTTFSTKDVPVKLAFAPSDQTVCTASLMDADFHDVTDSLTRKADEKFILRVSYDEGYDYKIGLNSIAENELKNYITSFTTEEYGKYIEHIQKNDISVPSNTDLFWIKTPYVAENELTVKITSSAEETFTILYQTTDKADKVWCRLTAPIGGQSADMTVDLTSDATLGGATVWSAKFVAAFDPTHVAFAATEEAAASASSSECQVEQSTATEKWTSYGETGKFVVIGGDAKTVIAAFIADLAAIPYYNVDTADFEPGNGEGVEYVIGVLNDGTATITAAGTPTKTGYDFVGWRRIVDKAEVQYDAGATNVAIKENTLFSAVWKRSYPTVKLNLNGGTIGTNITTIEYGQTLRSLNIQEPTRSGFAFEGWVAAKTVTEDGTLFLKDSPFDLDTKITSNLELSAKWKHIHSYKFYELRDYGVSGDETKLHVARCSCGDYKLMAHDFNSKKDCACGYHKGENMTKTVKVKYGQLVNNTFEAFGESTSQYAKYQTGVEFAPGSWNNLRFEKWMYSEDGGKTWGDFDYSTWIGYTVTCDLQLRAVYINTAKTARVELKSNLYRKDNNSPSTLQFTMNYQLPDGYTFVDAGVRLGDNEGISYYEIKEKKWSSGDKAIYGVATFLTGGGLFNSIMGAKEAGEKVQTYYEKRWDNVLDKEMTPQLLAKYMYEHKAVNVEKYPPIYMEARYPAKTSRGSMSTLCSTGIAQKNSGKNYVYGIAYLRYKDAQKKTHTIYTDAFAVNLLSPNGSTSQVGN